MAAGLIAALTALISSLLALTSLESGLSAAEPEDNPAAEQATVDDALDAFRMSVREWIEDIQDLARDPQTSPQVLPQAAESRPLDQDEPAEQEQALEQDEDGCVTREESGAGWAMRTVNCITQDAEGGSSLEISSSSSISVGASSSDDAP